MDNSDLKILCIDDEPAILELYSETIASAGLTPILCANPLDAERKFHDEMHNIALVICDLHMPQMSGFELRAAILPEALTVPFIVVSAHITKELALEALDLKIDGFFDKPVYEKDLAGLIEKYSKARIESIRESQALEATFLDEASALVDDMESVLLALDHDRTNADQLNLIFRYAHTIKGSSGVLSSDVITRYVHRYEDIISSLKKGQIEFTDSVYETLLQGFDRIKELISAAAHRKLRDYRVDDLQKELDLNSTALSPKVDLDTPKSQNSTAVAAPAQKQKDTISVPIEILEQLSGCSGEITVIRNMVNKLVRSLAQQNPGSSDVQNLGELLDEMHKVNGTVQHHITDLRKVPISNVLKTVPRIVRDLGKDLKKNLVLKITGEKLRIDNSLATVLSNSLVHLVRNSADHGVEDPSTRKAAGKPEASVIDINCREVGEEVLISISDDGRGIDPEKIRRIAMEKNLYTAVQLGEMTLSQTLAIIFASGFSTAAKVTDVSGRGVGMDMVRSSVEAAGGSITIDSEVGRGSTFTLRLPIPKSVLIITSLIVESAGRVFAVPQDSIQRALRIDLAVTPDAVQMASLGRILRQGERIYPLVSLPSILSFNTQESAKQSVSSPIPSSGILSVLILRSENLEYALMVDEIFDAEEIVVKSLNSYFNPKGAFIGATFMGDGSVGLILDITGIAKLANLDTNISTAAQSIEPNSKSSTHITHDVSTAPERVENLLLFRTKSKTLFGVPLAQVFRLEELDPAKVKHSGADRVVIYRDSIMPLLAFDRLLNMTSTKEDSISDDQDSPRSRIPTIVAKGTNGFFGLEVESVVDIAESESELSTLIRDRKGVIGNAFIANHNVTIVDLEKVLNRQILS